MSAEENRGAHPPRLVVGVGASAGGLDAFKRLLAALPADTGMAFVFVQHLDPSHPSLLTDLLTEQTAMAVRDADHGLALERDTVYVIRPGTALAIRDGRVELSEPKTTRGVRLAVDHLFASLGEEYGPGAVAVVLTGAGSDGSAGVRNVKAVGGLTIAQEPSTCSQPGMPQSAVDTGLIDLVLEIPDIPEALERFASVPASARAIAPSAPEPEERSGPSIDEADITRLASLLDAQASFDLRVYKHPTVERRVLRRMMLAGFESTEDYFEQLREDAGARRRLIRDLLIGVTDFFRDPEAFATLRSLVIEPLVAGAEPGTTLRAWVAGCSTGEEAYSIGMELLDAVEARGEQLAVQIFATDVDVDALAVARRAIYPAMIESQVSARRLEKYFQPLDDRGFRVRPALRDVVSFAAHDLTKDPPFSRMHLVSCRNVLIYLKAEAQRHVLGLLHFALDHGGHLFLSTSESVGSLRGPLLTTVSKPYRIYRRTRGAGRAPLTPPRVRPLTATSLQHHEKPPRGRPDPSVDDLARRAILGARVPPSVIAAPDGRITFSHGELSAYLRFPQGEDPQLDLMGVLRPHLATRARGAVYRARREGETVVAISDPAEGEPAVRITVTPLETLSDGSVLVSFETADEAPPAAAPPKATEHEGAVVVEQLERELEAAREDLRTTIEELETSNEELRSSNEESMSMNEELQSANEELEATSEELRSLNEELTTVNAQLREKIEQLEAANDDLHNFFASTKIATLFLDERLCIKRFTPAAQELLGVGHAHVGRSIVEAPHPLLRGDLAAEAHVVLEHLTPRSKEVRSADGWLARQVLPYRTEDRRIDGVVVTFVDITENKEATERAQHRERQNAVVAEIGMRALREPSLQAFLDHAVRDVQETCGVDLCKVLELQPGGEQLLLRAGVGWPDGAVGNVFVGTGRDSQAGFTLRSAHAVLVDDLRTEERFDGPALLRDNGVISGVSCVIHAGSEPYGVLGMHTTQQRSFAPEDAEFLQAVAHTIGAAITRYLTPVRLALEASVSTALADAEGEQDAVSATLSRLAEELGAAMVEVWTTQPTGAGYARVALHVDSDLDVSALERDMASALPSHGNFVSRVYRAGRALWFTELEEDAGFTRVDAARAHDLLSGIAFPIRIGKHIEGAIVLLARQRIFCDEALLRSLEGVGRALGEAIRRARAEKRTRASEALKGAVLDASVDAIVTIDADGRVMEANSATARLFGYERDELIGTDLFQRLVIAPAERELARRAFEAARDEATHDRVELSVTRADGREVPVELGLAQVPGVSPLAYTCFVRDITSRRASEKALHDAAQQKDDFLAMLGHELRNPLAAIRSASELLSRDDDPLLVKTQRVLDRQTAHMSKLLDGLIDISRIIRGKIALEREVVDLAQVCRDTVEDTLQRLGRRQLTVNADLSGAPVWVEGDRVRLAQVVDNLLSNAVKYTPDGGRIDVRLSADEEIATLRVRDTGKGIAPELLPHVFEAFRQAAQPLGRSEGGLGHGLALVRTLVELHGGEVSVHSAGESEGTELAVRVPLTDKAPSRRTPSAQPTSGARLLLIEDNEDAGEMLELILARRGHEVVRVTTGEEGVEQARAQPPDAILCDVGLAGAMSGYDVARTLRVDEATRGLPLVALTGYGRSEDRQRALDSGFDAHLTKPAEIEVIERVLAELGVF